MSTVRDDAWQQFASTLRGSLIRPSDAAYDEARHVWNGDEASTAWARDFWQAA